LNEINSMNTLAILFIVDGLYGGGKERQLVEIIKSLKSRDCKIGVITFNKNLHYTEVVKKQVDYFVELKKRPTRLEPFITAWRPIMRFKPDIIHTWDGISSVYAFLPARILNIKFVNGSIRDAGIEKGWRRWLKKRFLMLSDLVIANSKAGLLSYNAQGEVLYNAIDMDRFIRKRDTDAEFNLIMVANFNDYKDHYTFLKAAIALAGAGIVDFVYLLGDGPNRNKFESFVETNANKLKNRFIFAGAVKNVEDYLSKCRVGVLCSTRKYSEGLSNALLEYMAAGLVPIATDLGGSAEIISDNENGFLIEPENTEAIIQIVKKLKSDDSNIERIINNGLITLNEKFDFLLNTSKLFELYKNLLIS